jgi:hypothetical protein
MNLPPPNPATGIRPRITCADGVSLSVQAGPRHYSAPQTVEGPHHEVEVGFLENAAGERLPAPADWAPDDDVFPYVPVSIVEAFIAAHGGQAPSPSNP